MLPKINSFTNKQNKDNISSRENKLQYNNGVAMQDIAAQPWWYSKYW